MNFQGEESSAAHADGAEIRSALLCALIGTQPLRGGEELLRDPAIRLRLAEELRNQKLLSLAEFAGGASHEINNPLAIISGHAQYLLNHTEEEKWQKSLWTIIRQAERVSAILADVMRFARSGEPREEAVDVAGLVGELLAEYEPVAAPKRISLACEVPPDITLRADRGQFKHALGCLLVNSIEAVGRDGWLKWDAAVGGTGKLTVGIEDSGPGVDPAHLDHLFDPFFSGRSAGRGKGLGLSIAWRFADLHGGAIRYLPTAGGTTRFEIEFPEERLVAAAVRLAA